MSARSTDARTALALTGAVTVWITALSWRGFTEAWPAALVPLLGLVLVVALSGAGLRRLGAPGLLVVAAQVLLGAAATCLVLTGSPVPLGVAGQELVRSFALAVDSSTRYAAPVPAAAPGIEPLMIAGGLGCLILVDVLACTLRRVPLAGLPLLAVYSVPVSVLGAGASWWIFVAAAAGYLLMLHLDAEDAVTRWGRAMPDGGHADAAGFGVRTGSATAGAGVLGAGAVALAVALPLALPALHLDLLGGGSGPGGDGEIVVENPMTDLRRDLKQGADFPLVRVRTDDPDPAYLRISVLADFTENEWTAGDRSVPGDQVADGALPAPEGLDARVDREAYGYQVEVTAELESTWLPTQAPVSRVEAPGDWRYDTSTLDFIAADDDLTTAGLQYQMTAVEPRLEADELTQAPSDRGEVDSRFLQLPTGLPPVVGSLTADVTAGLANDFDRAVALQDFFRRDGGFRYSLARSANGNGADELAAFLSPGPGGRVGYCEQFASAMAVMARQVGIPSRVAVGFLQPRSLADGRWEYSARDLHAWPELYFPGAGWTRFEPTPPQRAADAPDYTEGDQAPAPLPAVPGSEADAPGGAEADRAENRPTPEVAESAPTPATGTGLPWRMVVPAALATVLLPVLLIVPGVVRRRRREHRLEGTVLDAWRELRDTALDLGRPWPTGRSPREVRTALAPHLGAHDDFDIVLAAVERASYAAPGSAQPYDMSEVVGAVRRCVTSLQEGAAARHRRRARWWPRTVVSPSTWHGRGHGATSAPVTAITSGRPRAEQLR